MPECRHLLHSPQALISKSLSKQPGALKSKNALIYTVELKALNIVRAGTSGKTKWGDCTQCVSGVHWLSKDLKFPSKPKIIICISQTRQQIESQRHLKSAKNGILMYENQYSFPALFLHVLWFNPSWRLGTTQLLACSLLLLRGSRRIGKERWALPCRLR